MAQVLMEGNDLKLVYTPIEEVNIRKAAVLKAEQEYITAMAFYDPTDERFISAKEKYNQAIIALEQP